MTKEVFVSWEEQICIMEYHADATGICEYDKIRELMAQSLRYEHGRHCFLILEEIPDCEIESFEDFLNDDED